MEIDAESWWAATVQAVARGCRVLLRHRHRHRCRHKRRPCWSTRATAVDGAVVAAAAAAVAASGDERATAAKCDCWKRWHCLDHRRRRRQRQCLGLSWAGGWPLRRRMRRLRARTATWLVDRLEVARLLDSPWTSCRRLQRSRLDETRERPRRCPPPPPQRMRPSFRSNGGGWSAAARRWSSAPSCWRHSGCRRRQTSSTCSMEAEEAKAAAAAAAAEVAVMLRTSDGQRPIWTCAVGGCAAVAGVGERWRCCCCCRGTRQRPSRATERAAASTDFADVCWTTTTVDAVDVVATLAVAVAAEAATATTDMTRADHRGATRRATCASASWRATMRRCGGVGAIGVPLGADWPCADDGCWIRRRRRQRQRLRGWQTATRRADGAATTWVARAAAAVVAVDAHAGAEARSFAAAVVVVVEDTWVPRPGSFALFIEQIHDYVYNCETKTNIRLWMVELNACVRFGMLTEADEDGGVSWWGGMKGDLDLPMFEAACDDEEPLPSGVIICGWLLLLLLLLAERDGAPPLELGGLGDGPVLLNEEDDDVAADVAAVAAAPADDDDEGGGGWCCCCCCCCCWCASETSDENWLRICGWCGWWCMSWWLDGKNMAEMGMGECWSWCDMVCTPLTTPPMPCCCCCWCCCCCCCCCWWCGCCCDCCDWSARRLLFFKIVSSLSTFFSWLNKSLFFFANTTKKYCH